MWPTTKTFDTLDSSSMRVHDGGGTYTEAMFRVSVATGLQAMQGALAQDTSFGTLVTAAAIIKQQPRARGSHVIIMLRYY